MSQALLVINAGSSSLKFALYPATAATLATAALPAQPDLPWLRGQIEGISSHPTDGIRSPPQLQARTASGDIALQRDLPLSFGQDEALACLLDAIGPFLQGHTLCAVGHRIVHGGIHHHAPVLLTDAVWAELNALVPLAPLHQAHNLAPVRALQRVAPGLPQVGCFDTAFHTTCAPLTQRFALPRELHEAGVRRYGFHGLSYEHIAQRLPQLDARAAGGRTVAMHLGNGASMCALQGGQSMATSMGFTALDGLMMGTRCGTLDAGVLLWLMDERGMDARAIEHLLYRESGLLGVSGGLSSDMRTLLASAQPEAQEAVALYVHRITRELGALVAVLGGLDAIVFTGGIGEHAAPIRAQVCAQAAWLGVRLDDGANLAASVSTGPGMGQRISTRNSAIAVWVMPTDEEHMIAQHTRRIALALGAAP